MAVDIDLNNITSGYNVSKINANNDKIEVAFEDALSRTGTGPNQMEADLDMNSNDILNVNRIDVMEFYMDGSPVISIPDIEAVLAIADNIAAVAAIDDDVTIVADNIADVITTATNITNVNTVATNIANINVVAADITDINTVASNIADVNTVAANIVDIQNAEENADAAAASAAAAEAAAEDLELAGVPVGTVLMRHGGDLFPGFIAFGEGGSFDTGVYPELATWMSTNFPALAAGQLPDWRDYSPRTAGGALGPAVGVTQEDAMQRITGTFASRTGTGIPTGAITAGGASTADSYQPGGNTFQIHTFDSGTSAGARVSNNETRVKSFGVRWQIKAYGAIVNQGTADLVAIEQGYNTLSVHAIRDDVDQNAQSKVAADKINILKNTLQAWEQVSTETVVTSSTTWVSWSNLAFSELRLTWSDVRPVTDGAELALQISTDNGATWISATNYIHQLIDSSASVVGAAAVSSGTYMKLSTGVGNVSPEKTWGVASLFNAIDTGRVTYVTQGGSRDTSATLHVHQLSGEYAVDAAVNAIRVLFSSGNIAVGRFLLEGHR